MVTLIGKKFPQNKKLKKNQGFSLMEIVIAISIIVVGILGVLSLTERNVKVQSVNKNNLIASFLAQEGIELIRNIRDTEWKTGSSSGVFDNDTNLTIYFDIGEEEIKVHTGVSDIDNNKTNLYLSSENRYRHFESPPLGLISNFKRMIELRNVSSNPFDVNCIVQWEERGNTHQYIVSAKFYDWY